MNWNAYELEETEGQAAKSCAPPPLIKAFGSQIVLVGQSMNPITFNHRDDSKIQKKGNHFIVKRTTVA